MNRLDFGMPTLLELRTVERCAALCRELGLQFVELNAGMPEYQPERIDIERFAHVAEEYGVYYTIHLDDAPYPCHINERIARALIDTMRKTVEIAKKLHIPVINMHFNQGDYFTLPDRKVYIYEDYFDEYMRMLERFRDECEDAVGGSNVRICVENTRSFALGFVAAGLDCLLKSRVFGLTFDTGHDAANGGSQFPTIERNIDRLCHMHLHDWCVERGDHLPLGEGGIDIEKRLAIAREHGCRVVLETKTADGVRRSTHWLKTKK